MMELVKNGVVWLGRSIMEDKNISEAILWELVEIEGKCVMWVKGWNKDDGLGMVWRFDDRR